MPDSDNAPHLVVLPRNANVATELVNLANPARLHRLVGLEDVERHRSLLCDLYDRCLDSALRQAWHSWTCQHCPLFVLAGAYRSLQATQQGAMRPSA